MKTYDSLRKFDWLLIAAVFLLVIVGLAALYSVGLSQSVADFSNFKKQIMFSLIGFGGLFFVGLTNYSFFRVHSRTIYVVTLVLLFLVLIFGSTINGTRGWFSFFGLGIQPAELAKVALIITLSKFFSNRFQNFQPTKHFLVSIFFLGSLALLILMQPDLGSVLILGGVWFLLFLLTNPPKRYLAAIVLVCVMVVSFSWFFILHDYQKERVLNFIYPENDPRGSGYNVTQSIIGIGAGQLWGRGLGFGSQSQLKFIPESQTDFIFAVIAEELGLLGISLVLLLWGVIFYRLIVISRRAADDFGQFMVLGIASLFLLHLFVNVGMNMGLMPVMGISLPFVSYGGSFLVVCLGLVGIAEGVAVRR